MRAPKARGSSGVPPPPHRKFSNLKPLKRHFQHFRADSCAKKVPKIDRYFLLNFTKGRCYHSCNVFSKLRIIVTPLSMLAKYDTSFLRPRYPVQFSQQLVSQCRCETSCWRIAHCNMGFLPMFLLREGLHEVELISTFRNGLQQLVTPLHSVSPLQQLVSQFYGSFNKGACAHFLFFVPRSIARQVAEKIAQCNRTSTPNFGNLQRYIFNHCGTSC